MAKVFCYPRHKNKINGKRKSADKIKKTTSVVIHLTDGRDNVYRVQSGISINPDHWSEKNENVLSADSDSVAKNKRLKNLREKVLAVYLDFKNTGVIPTTEELKNALKPKKQEEQNLDQPKDFWSIYQLFLQAKSKRTQPTTIQKLKQTEVQLKEYEKDTGHRWTFDSTTAYRLEDLQSWLIETKNHQNSYVVKRLNFLKTFFLWCYRHDFTECRPFDKFEPLSASDTKKITLTPKELDQIRNLEIPQEKSYLTNARKLFLLSCLTGLRNSDYSRISQEHYKQTEDGATLEIVQKKTTDQVIIPLNPEAKAIVLELLDKEDPTHTISQQKLNNYVKELCELAGINELIELVEKRGEKIETKVKPKFELITTHTGRRTFATNLVNKGAPVSVVMALTGHKTERSFWQYVNTTKEQAQKQARKFLNLL
jgi:site-specific recombinase XerD